ncbi:hypothetical protein QAD02_010321 [Eretmocerus hayati]|uniref:Uncharacterized protein n=1 Tax=Eretmocerus hayati TaxID=131215 RepID=A0ACC2ND08_9HYME|nr:hypothetical protein QAD02_010321 [Eretmocerus hayati]
MDKRNSIKNDHVLFSTVTGMHEPKSNLGAISNPDHANWITDMRKEMYAQIVIFCSGVNQGKISRMPSFLQHGFADEKFQRPGNFSCDDFYLPSSPDFFNSLGNFGVALLAIGSLLCSATIYLALDACGRICSQPNHRYSTSFKINACSVISVYPIAGLCSLAALALPRSQLLSEALTQLILTVSLYRLFDLLLELASKSVGVKAPTLRLNVGPCCCWPCLPLPSPQADSINLTKLRLAVLQLPVVQGLVYVALLYLSSEAPTLGQRYLTILQPVALSSILLAVYGLTVLTKSLQPLCPDVSLQQRTSVLQMVLLFSKLQGILIKSLPDTGIFPCEPPLTPLLYANVTYNSLMVIEMLMLCFAARLIYSEPNDANNDNQNSSGGGNDDDDNDEERSKVRDHHQPCNPITSNGTSLRSSA